MKAPQIDNFLANRENHPLIMDEISILAFNNIWYKITFVKAKK